MPQGNPFGLSALSFSKKSLVSTHCLQPCGQTQPCQGSTGLQSDFSFQNIQEVVLSKIELHELLFPFRDQLELFENQKHVVLANHHGGLVVSRIQNLYKIAVSIKSDIVDARHFWILQGNILRKINVQYLRLEKQIKLKTGPIQSIVGHESDQYCVWLLTDNKYLHMNDKFVGMLPFDLKYGAKSMVYSQSNILISEKYNLCHLFELNEFYNIINHQVFKIFESI